MLIKYIKLKLIMSWILFPTVHICVRAAHATLAGAPLPQHSLLWDQTWWDECAWRAPSGSTSNDIYDHLGAKQLGVKVWFGCRTSPKLGLDLSSGTSHTISVHVFLRPVCQMPVWGHQSCIWILLKPICWGICTPFHPCKPKGVHFAYENLPS